jgi:predicted DNA binding CopG/RHH family protein
MKYKLDEYEQEIEDNFENMLDIPNLSEELSMLKNAAINHLKNKKSITIRIAHTDLEVMKIKASKCGIPYQTYINMLIHLDASKL